MVLSQAQRGATPAKKFITNKKISSAIQGSPRGAAVGGGENKSARGTKRDSDAGSGSPRKNPNL